MTHKQNRSGHYTDLAYFFSRCEWDTLNRKASARFVFKLHNRWTSWSATAAAFHACTPSKQFQHSLQASSPMCNETVLNEHLYGLAKRILTCSLSGKQHQKVLHWCWFKNDRATVPSPACTNNTRQCSSQFPRVSTHGMLSARLYVRFKFSSHHLGWRFLWCV